MLDHGTRNYVEEAQISCGVSFAPAGGQGGVPTLQQFSSGALHLVGLNRKEALQLVVRNLWRQNMNGERPKGYWWYKRVSVPVRQRFSKRMRCRKVLCENLINALKLLANQQKDGDGSIQSIVTGLLRKKQKRN